MTPFKARSGPPVNGYGYLPGMNYERTTLEKSAFLRVSLKRLVRLPFELFIKLLTQYLGATIFWIAGFTALPSISKNFSTAAENGAFVSLARLPYPLLLA